MHLPDISIICPALNEAPSLPEWLERVRKAVCPLETRHTFEFLIVDDGSTDNSREVLRELAAREPRLRVLTFRRNFGKSQALLAGLDHALAPWVLTLDADLQHAPEEIPRFVEALESGAAYVSGVRILPKRAGSRRLANSLLRAACGIPLRDPASSFQAFHRALFQDAPLTGNFHRYLSVYAFLSGAPLAEIEAACHDRRHGQSRYTAAKALDFPGVLACFFLRRFGLNPASPVQRTYVLAEIAEDRPVTA